MSRFLAIAFVLMMAAPAAHAEGTINTVGTFDDGTVHVDMDTYTDGPQVVALVGMKGNGISISFAFDKAEWPKLLALWQKAEGITGSDYKTAGSLKEVGSSAQCVITMAGGPAIRVTIVDPTLGALVYVFSSSDQARFDDELRQIGDASSFVN